MSAPIPRSTATGHPAELRGAQELVVRAARRTAAQHRTDRNAGMTRSTGTLIKFRIFGVIMAMLTAFLFVVFSEIQNRCDRTAIRRCSPTRRGWKPGDTVRIAGIRVGTVQDVSLQADRKVLVKFDTDRNIEADHRHQGRDPLPQPGRGSLSRTRRHAGVDEDPACRRADTRGSHRARAGPRPAARWSQTRYPGPESTRRQRADRRR